jgi:hypothetical protein
MSELEQALWQAFDGSLAVSGVAKHANHDQKSHGNWAKDRPSSPRLSTEEWVGEINQWKREYESLSEQARQYTVALRSVPMRTEGLGGAAVVEAITGAKPDVVTLAAADSSDGNLETTRLAFFREKSLDPIAEAIMEVQTLRQKLEAAEDFTPSDGSDRTLRMFDTEPEWEREANTILLPGLQRVESVLELYYQGSQLLADNVDLDLLATPPPDGKMSSWADSVAANPDGGVGFMEGVRSLAQYPIQSLRTGETRSLKFQAGGEADARTLMMTAGGELLSAHIRMATSGAVEERLNPRVGRLTLDKPGTYQQEQPLSAQEFNDPLFEMLPSSTFRTISNIMDVAVTGVGSLPLDRAERGTWVNKLFNPKVAGTIKHSVNSRLAERMYGQATYADGTLNTDLGYLYSFANNQTRAWASSAASTDSAKLQQVVADMVGRPESFDSFAERQDHRRIPDNRFTPYTVAYAQAVYAETQALLDINPSELSVKAARGTMLRRDTKAELPVKVVEVAIASPTQAQSSRLRDASWEVSTDEIGRQPLSSWSTSTKVAHQFANLSPNESFPVPAIGAFHIVQRAMIPDSQIFSTALTGPGCVAEQEIIAIEGTSGTTSVSVVFSGQPAEENMVLNAAKARDADGDGWIYEGTDQAMFVGKADKKFEYSREVPEQSREGIDSLLTWIPDNWDAAYLIDEPS